MTETRPESRTFHLDQEALQELLDTRRAACPGMVERINRALPDNLSVREIDDIGLQVSHETERRWPSRNGYSRGLESEQEVVFNIGTVAVLMGDMVTVESAITHLKSKKDRIGAGILWLEKRRARKANRSRHETT